MAIARDHRAQLRGLTFHWLERGAPGARPLLMLHGGAQTAHSFDEVAPDLARDHHVVCIDQRGHGDTSWTPRYRRDDFVGDVEALLDRFGWDATTLVGMSLGGLNSIACAARRPARVRALVVVDVIPSVTTEGRDSITKQLAVQEFDRFEDAVASAHAFNPRRTVENIRERLGQAMREGPDGKWRYKYDPGIASGIADIDRLWSDVRRIACPTLLVRGAESPMITDAGVERFLRETRHGRIATVAGAGHSVMGDNPAGFLAAVRPFLARYGA